MEGAECFWWTVDESKNMITGYCVRGFLLLERSGRKDEFLDQFARMAKADLESKGLALFCHHLEPSCNAKPDVVCICSCTPIQKISKFAKRYIYSLSMDDDFWQQMSRYFDTSESGWFHEWHQQADILNKHRKLPILHRDFDILQGSPCREILRWKCSEIADRALKLVLVDENLCDADC